MSNAAWLVKFIRDHARDMMEPSAHLAVVSSLEPLRVQMQGVELGAPFLMAVPKLLTRSYVYDATFTTNTTMSGRLTVTPSDPGPLQVGDTVLVLPVQDKYIVVTKVVPV
jgi:hypothetical protein